MWCNWISQTVVLSVGQSKCNSRCDETIIPQFTWCALRAIFTLQVQESSPDLTDSDWDFFYSEHGCKVLSYLCTSYSKNRHSIIAWSYISRSFGPKLETKFSLVCSTVFGMHRWLQVRRVLLTWRRNDMSECQILLLHNSVRSRLLQHILKTPSAEYNCPCIES